MSSPDSKSKELPAPGPGYVLNNDPAQHDTTVPFPQRDSDERDKASTMTEDQDDGVTRIEALYLVFGKGWRLVMLWASIGLIAYVYALSQSTTWVYLQLATSAFSRHAALGTIGVINGLIAAIAQPIIAKLCDLSSRPAAYFFAVLFYCLGYIIVAASKTVGEVAGGEVLFTIGNTAISLINTIIVADMTSLQNRGLVNSLMASPFILNAFVAAYITDGISAFTENGWRWGYGMFVILVPVCIAPALIVLFWADRKARRTGALSLASSSYARKQVLKQQGALQMSGWQQVVYYWHRVDVVGLVLLGFSFGLILVPVTLQASMEGGYANKSIIAMFATGAALWFVFIGWEWKFAKYPIMPKRVLNRSLICSCVIDFFYFLSYYVAGTYWLSWVYVVKDWDTKSYTMFSNILTVGLCFFGIIAGLLQRYFHRYKVIQLVGLFLRLIGNGLVFYAYKNPTDAVLVMSQILGSAGGGFSVIGSMLAAQASVPHQDTALAISLLNLWTQAGGAVGAAIGASIWTNRLPEMLTKHLSADLNATEIADIYGSILVARAAEPREKVVAAYQEAGYYIFLPALILTAVPVLAGFLTSNFYLDTRHNVVEDKEVVMRPEEETEERVLREKVAQAEEEARRQLGIAPEQSLHRH